MPSTGLVLRCRNGEHRVPPRRVSQQGSSEPVEKQTFQGPSLKGSVHSCSRRPRQN